VGIGPYNGQTELARPLEEAGAVKVPQIKKMPEPCGSGISFALLRLTYLISTLAPDPPAKGGLLREPASD